MTTNIITIEKNVPIPVCIRTNNTVKYSFMRNLKVTDSFYINGNTPDFAPVGVRAYIYGLNAKTNRKYTIRTVEGPSKNPLAIRVWRVR